MIEVEGIPFVLGENLAGYYVEAVGQRVDIAASPVVISFDPPIAPTVDLGEVYQAILAQLPKQG